MITQDDIFEFSEEEKKAVQVAGLIVDRAKSGHPPLRLWSADQEMQFIRAYMTMLTVAETALAIIADYKQRQIDAMSLGEPPRKD